MTTMPIILVSRTTHFSSVGWKNPGGGRIFSLANGAFGRLAMLEVLRQKIWWLAITSADVSQHGEIGASAAALVAAILLKALAHAISLSWPQASPDRRCRELASSPARIRLSNEAG
jgi:hypothetical protein